MYHNFAINSIFFIINILFSHEYNAPFFQVFINKYGLTTPNASPIETHV